jgi:hypothetical protein
VSNWFGVQWWASTLCSHHGLRDDRMIIEHHSGGYHDQPPRLHQVAKPPCLVCGFAGSTIVTSKLWCAIGVAYCH